LKIFDDKKKWYKGNLHTHTTNSDGHISVSDCINLYKGAKYDFLAITDHLKCFKCIQQDGFLVLSGVELHLNDLSTRKAFHLVGIGIDDDIDFFEGMTPQEMIDRIKESHGIAILAHPLWSLVTHNDIMELRGLDGFEIWNTVSETHSSRGDSSSYADVLASNSCFPLLFASDDAHFYTTDFFGGYIMVNSASLEQKDILSSIKSGSFYCSQGPEIKQISYDIMNKVINIETSPVMCVSFLSDTFYCANRVTEKEGELFTEAEYKLTPTDRVVRIQCKDEKGNMAWSQYIRASILE
jgi:hypothetical protein